MNEQLAIFRKRVDFLAGQSGQKTNNICAGYVQELVDEYGRLEMRMEPYAFSIYTSPTGDLVYEKKGVTEYIGENNGRSILEMIHLFRDEIQPKKIEL